MQAIIKSHNNRIITTTTPAIPKKMCNCRDKDSCPLRGKCLTTALVYKATVSGCGVEPKTYIGISGGPFKQRYYNHRKSFNHQKHAKDTELSKYIWALKEEEKSFEIKWEILKTSNTKQRASSQCNLCVEEKVEITLANNMNLLNRRTELLSKCRHSSKPKR
ncbi:hypothetical protein HOLleu_17316 [Holothuria leucospilota]|uniref:Uncharacterized protein n=1 Tax=Holothuria leucospilota TaxID=206669 RepID=A0A9Q1C6I5_HOLLE|nr:hypothetical protein HOLleu_17316 [Holothuria leucospilota]